MSESETTPSTTKRRPARAVYLLRARALPLTVLLLTACAQSPEVAAALGPDPVGTDYPDLLPWEDIAAIETGVPDSEREATLALEARAADLRRRTATP